MNKIEGSKQKQHQTIFLNQLHLHIAAAESCCNLTHIVRMSMRGPRAKFTASPIAGFVDNAYS